MSNVLMILLFLGYITYCFLCLFFFIKLVKYLFKKVREKELLKDESKGNK